ncbi:hypothetical protein D9M71_694770 [compost metagenome]
MGHGVCGAHAAGAPAYHHAEGRARLQAFHALRIDHRLGVAVAGVRGLDEQHRLDRRLLIGRQLEFVQTALQQAPVVQRYAEQGAGGDVVECGAHGSSPVDKKAGGS